MNEDKMGQPHKGCVNYKADPANMFNETKKIHEDYQKELIITTDCKLTGLKLIKVFFNNVFNMLKLNVSNNLKKVLNSKQYEKIKKNTDDFNIEKIEKYLKYSELKDYKKAWIEMQNFQVIVVRVGGGTYQDFCC